MAPLGRCFRSTSKQSLTWNLRTDQETPDIRQTGNLFTGGQIEELYGVIHGRVPAHDRQQDDWQESLPGPHTGDSAKSSKTELLPFKKEHVISPQGP